MVSQTVSHPRPEGHSPPKTGGVRELWSQSPSPPRPDFLKSSFYLLIKVIAAHYRECRKHEVTKKTILGQHGLSHLY